jgi:hypothetical protein
MTTMDVLTSYTRHAITVAEYMSSDMPENTELIDGVVYDVSPTFEPHTFAVRALNKRLVPALAAEYCVQTGNAIAVDGWHGTNAPEVDVAVIVDRAYDGLPTAADTIAFVEVSHTTYRDDRRVKIPMYVRTGVPTYLVNVPKRHVECYESEADLALAHGRVVAESEVVTIAGVAIPAAVLFIPAKA